MALELESLGLNPTSTLYQLGELEQVTQLSEPQLLYLQ
jgi:hypothetical protein